VFIFQNGEGYSILRTSLPGDDGTPVTSLQIFDHQGAVSIGQASGSVYDLPWDSIKYYASGRKQRRLWLGKKLKTIRCQKKMSQKDLSEKSGISRMQLSRIEANRSIPTVDTVARLARVLRIQPSEFISSRNF